MGLHSSSLTPIARYISTFSAVHQARIHFKRKIRQITRIWPVALVLHPEGRTVRAHLAPVYRVAWWRHWLGRAISGPWRSASRGQKGVSSRQDQLGTCEADQSAR